jgi:hypothetical protein
MRLLFIVLLATPAVVDAQVYRWIDERGTTHYSNAPPPGGVKPTLVDIEAKPGAPSADTTECHTVRCQGERMEERVARRDQAEARAAAERVIRAPKPARGLEFRKYISIQRGMSEGELIGLAGPADLAFRDRDLRTYTYLPTSADPFTTTVTVVRGRVSEVERVRKF